MDVSLTLQRACRVLRRRVRYRDAGFSLTDPNGMTNDADTEKIQDSTRAYVESWIVPLLDAIERGDTQLLRKLVELSPADPIDP